MRIKIKSGLLGNLEGNPSEIPCRVSNIAPSGSDPVQQTGSNRWNPNDARRRIEGNTEGKITAT